MDIKAARRVSERTQKSVYDRLSGGPVMMSSTLLEVTRAGHKEFERLERLIVKDLQNEPASSKDRLFQNHRVRNMIDEITTTTLKLVEIYEDKDNSRKDEITALGGQTATGTNGFSAFYDRLKEIREFHRRHPAARVVDINEEYEELLKEEPRIEFTGEEALGRYLDMHELYNEYINSKFGEPIEYSAYLEIFSQPEKLPCKLKVTRQYREYLEKLQEYLIYFFERTEPLQDLGRIFLKVIAKFEEQWANGKVQGWENEGQENGHISAQPAVIDLDYYSTIEELMEVGPERLKEALAALGLKTGGTVQQRADRLFLTKGQEDTSVMRKHCKRQRHGAPEVDDCILDPNSYYSDLPRSKSGDPITAKEHQASSITSEVLIRQRKNLRNMPRRLRPCPRVPPMRASLLYGLYKQANVGAHAWPHSKSFPYI